MTLQNLILIVAGGIPAVVAIFCLVRSADHFIGRQLAKRAQRRATIQRRLSQPVR